MRTVPPTSAAQPRIEHPPEQSVDQFQLECDVGSMPGAFRSVRQMLSASKGDVDHDDLAELMAVFTMAAESIRDRFDRSGRG